MSGLYTHLRKINPRMWRIWYRMNYRCRTNQKNYEHVEVCSQWHFDDSGEQGFINFYDDMIKGYKDDLELDRINTFGNYEPNNCRWTTRLINRNNRRWHSSEIANAHKIRKAHGINRYTFYGRLERGWDMKTAATEPVKPNRMNPRRKS